jgi:hypothetical protein
MGEARGIPHSTTAAYAIIFATIVLATCGIRKPETACEWVAPRSSETLLDDIKRAEDIAIRHVDAKTLGAGTLRRRETHQQCEARLFGATTFALVVAAVWVMAAMPAPRTRLARPRHPGTSP